MIDSGYKMGLQENAMRLAIYRYAKVQMVELMGGWAQSVPEAEIKVSFGRQMYQDMVHADLLGKRLPELKVRRKQRQLVAPSDSFVRMLEKIWKAEDSVRRMIALYRILKPGLVEALSDHLVSIALPEDEPTERILRSIIETERDNIEWGEEVISRLMPEREGKQPEYLTWQKELEAAWTDCGGITPGVPESSSYTFLKEFEYSLQPVRDARWTIADDVSGYTEKGWSFDTVEGKLHLLHDLLNSEFVTVERMGRILAEFPDLPWETRFDMARQAWDEARHAEIIQRRLEELGGYVGMYPINFWGWEMDVNRPDPLERLALSNMTFERESSKHVREWILQAKRTDDPASVHVLEYILADEVTHVQYGLHWVDALTKDDPERRKRVLEYPRSVLANRHPVGVKFGETTDRRDNIQ